MRKRLGQNARKLEIGLPLIFIFGAATLWGVHSLTAAVTTIEVTVVDDSGVVPDVTVRGGSRFNTSVTDADGTTVITGLTADEPALVSAYGDGYFITRAGSHVPGEGPIEITLTSLEGVDNEDYSWVSAFADAGEPENCERCHTEPTDPQSTLPFDEWLRDPHSQAAENPRFLSMYLGRDLLGNQSPPTRFGRSREYGRFPLPPDLTQPYYGPGYVLDWPGSAGNCASCHTPVAAVNHPFSTNPTEVSSVATEGVTCDFCHKVADVILDPETLTPFPNTPASLSYVLHRPPENHQYFSTTRDVALDGGSYSPVLQESAFCAPCHFGVFWDTVIYNSYGEWLDSSYSDPETGQTCQDCHMTPTGTTVFAHPDAGGREHDPATIPSHDMTVEHLLNDSVTMQVTAQQDGDALQVEVSITNDRTGHHVPTDSPLRHMILLVEAVDENGQPLDLVTGPLLPDWCGIGDADNGYFAGLPGTAFAKVLMNVWTAMEPTGNYWTPTVLVSDNRIPANATDTSEYVFQASPGGESTVTVRLLYRRAFIALMDLKGWEDEDIVMEEEIRTVNVE